MKIYQVLAKERRRHPVVVMPTSKEWDITVDPDRCKQCHRWWEERPLSSRDVDLSASQSRPELRPGPFEDRDVGPKIIVQRADVSVLRIDFIQQLEFPGGFHLGHVTVDGEPWPLYRSVVADASVRVRVLPIHVGLSGSCAVCGREGIVAASNSGKWVEHAAVAGRHVFAGQRAGDLPYISESLARNLSAEIRQAVALERLEVRE